MQNEYYYLGRSTGLAKLHDSNAFICVDTRSWEALIYIQGYPVEPQEMSVMRRFVGPGDVFLDIGSNFGLYSMMASERIGSQGKLFAFEANPHTYQYLRQSAIANRLIWLPNYKWENLAISDGDGELEFAFNHDNLGSGHIRNAADSPDTHEIVVVKATSIDNYLSGGIKVDFAKIDVEGHELPVLKGMIETIARSPSIRIMLEYYTYTDDTTEYGKNIVEFVRSIGLGLCRVEGDGSLSVVPENEIPRGNIYLLATRTPEEDARRPASCISLRPKGMNLHPVFAQGAHQLTTPEGLLRYDRDDHEDVAEPTLFFGPYIDLPAGNYRLNFQAKAEGTAHVSVTANAGHSVILAQNISNWDNALDFHIDEAVQQFEIVLRRTSNLKSLELSEIQIECL